VRSSLDFGKTYKSGRKFVDSAFVMFQRGNGLEFNRIGLSVSRKVGNAVARNRSKRYLREFYRLSRPEQVVGNDIVVVCRVGFTRLSFADAQVRFLRAMLKLGCYKNSE